VTTIEESVLAVLEETILALSELDLERLQTLEERALLLARSTITTGSIPALLGSQHLLGHLLEATMNNLSNLTRLNKRNGENVWVP
jgi:hypothetical protein